MAWPLTPIATFVDNGGTPCNSSFLNQVQLGVQGIVGPQTINSVANQMYTLAGLKVDGVGGNSYTATPGVISASTSINAPTLYATGNSSADLVIPAVDMQVGVNPSKVAFGVTNWTFITDATGTIVCPIELPFQDGGATSTTTITQIDFRLNQAGPLQGVVSLNKVNNINNTGGGPSGSVVSTLNTGIGSGNKIVSLTTIGYVANLGETLYCQIQPGQANDVIYAVTVHYTYKLF